MIRTVIALSRISQFITDFSTIPNSNSKRMINITLKTILDIIFDPDRLFILYTSVLFRVQRKRDPIARLNIFFCFIPYLYINRTFLCILRNEKIKISRHTDSDNRHKNNQNNDSKNYSTAKWLYCRFGLLIRHFRLTVGNLRLLIKHFLLTIGSLRLLLCFFFRLMIHTALWTDSVVFFIVKSFSA